MQATLARIPDRSLPKGKGYRGVMDKFRDIVGTKLPLFLFRLAAWNPRPCGFRLATCKSWINNRLHAISGLTRQNPWPFACYSKQRGSLAHLLKRDKHGSQWRILDRGCKEGATQALVDSSSLRFGAWRDGSAGGHADPEAIHITDAGAGRTSSCL